MPIRVAMLAALMLAGQCGASTPRDTVPEGAKRIGRDRILLPDRVNYSKGSYLAYASPWCAATAKSLVVGRDLVNTIELRPSTFPDDTRIAVSAPLSHPNRHGCGVYGYHFVSFGNYDGGRVRNPVRPARVTDIARLKIAFDVDPAGSKGDYNILNELFLTRRPGAAADKVAEVGYFLHPSDDAIRFARRGKSHGSYTDPAGHAWEVYKADAFVMLLPARGDLLSGTLDVGHLLRDLAKRGAVPGDAWFNGVALGLEPVGGKSQLLVKRWTVDYRPKLQ